MSIANREMASPLTADIKPNGGLRRVTTTPWAVFVHSSPIYVTSDLPVRYRRGRPTSHRNGAPHRRGMRLPDDYPYANRRWSERLRALRAVRHDVGVFS
ncbi:MAG: hypothetical protein V2A56_07265 [bacterium]